MSTKTNFKRIALVAVAALGLGVLSSVPSQAAISGLTVTTANGTGTTTNYDSSTGATITVSGLLDATLDCVTVTYVAKSAPSGVTVGANTGILRFLDSTTAATASSTIVDTGVALASALAIQAANASGLRSGKLDSVTTANDFKGFRITGSTSMIIGASFRMELDSAVAATAGTYVFQVNVTQHAATGAGGLTATRTTTAYDLSIVVTATGNASKTPSAGATFSRMGPDSVVAGASDASDSVLAVSAVAGTTRGTIFVAVRNAAGGTGTAEDSLTAVVTGVGNVCFGSACGKNLKIAATGDTSITLQGDGNGGSSSITITSSVTGVVYTHSLTYYGTASKLTAAVYNPVLKMGANPTAVAVVGTDTAGANWAGAAYIYASTATDALVGGSATTPVACSYSAADLTHFCPITTLTAGTAKFKVINAATIAAATVTSNEVTVTASNALPASVKLAFNKASYVAGEKAYITVTVLDSAGKTLQGQTYSNLFATGGITSSYGFASGSDTLTAVEVATDVANSATTPTTAGAKTYTVYMPTTGSVTISATGGTTLPAAGQVKVTATATVTDKASEALAAVNALAVTVASLRTLITTLTNLVLKIQKKVKA